MFEAESSGSYDTDMVLKVADGGTETTAMRLSGSTQNVDIPNGNLNVAGNTTVHGRGGLTMKNGDIQMSDNSVANAKEYDLGNGMKLTKKGDTVILTD